MKNIFKILLCFLILMTFADYNTVIAQTTTAKPAVASSVTAISVSPLDVVNTPDKYLNKSITFTAEFVAFTSLGLDYKPAYKDPAKYIGILVKRPDVVDHTIPLSEMKMFLKREIAEKYADIDAGDKVKITGTVFSTALGDPWVDITAFEQLTKKTKDEKK